MKMLTHSRPKMGRQFPVLKDQKKNPVNPSNFKWVVTSKDGDDRFHQEFVSTDGLVDKFKGKGSAILFFEDNEVHAPLSAGRKAMYSLKKGSEGLVAGAAIGVVGTLVAGYICASLGQTGIIGPMATGLIGGGAVLGAGRGIFKAINSDQERVQKSVTGRLQIQNDEALFRPHGSGNVQVDLNEFKMAKAPEKLDGKLVYGSQWWNSEPDVRVGRMYRDTWNPADFFSGGSCNGA